MYIGDDVVLAEIGLMLLGFVGGFVGSTVLWLTVGRRIVADAVLKKGRQMVEDWLDEALPSDPNHEPADPRLNRAMRYMEAHVSRAILAGFAGIEKGVSNAIGTLTDAPDAPGGIGGLGGLLGAIPGVGKGSTTQLSGLATLFQLFQQFQAGQGGGNNSGGGWKE